MSSTAFLALPGKTMYSIRKSGRKKNRKGRLEKTMIPPYLPCIIASIAPASGEITRYIRSPSVFTEAEVMISS